MQANIDRNLGRRSGTIVACVRSAENNGVDRWHTLLRRQRRFSTSSIRRAFSITIPSLIV
jgi:hypothetical protein